MWLGFWLSIIIGGLLSVLVGVIIEDKRIKKTIIILVVYVGVIIFCTFMGAFIEKEQLNKGIEKYKASKSTIECSLQNENLSGAERIELVKLATEKNEWLAETKYKVKRWYNFHLRDNDVLELELINFNKEEK